MAKTVYRTEEVQLQDGTDVVVRPLAIGRLRRFYDAWSKVGELKEGEDGFNIYVNCSGIALEENFKGQYERLQATADEKAEGEVLSPEYKAYLEGVLDLETIFLVMEVAGGIKLNDPNLLAAAAELTD